MKILRTFSVLIVVFSIFSSVAAGATTVGCSLKNEHDATSGWCTPKNNKYRISGDYSIRSASSSMHISIKESGGGLTPVLPLAKGKTLARYYQSAGSPRGRLYLEASELKASGTGLMTNEFSALRGEKNDDINDEVEE